MRARELIKEAKACGDCFVVAGRAMIDPQLPGMKLVHAYVSGQGKLEGKRFAHAWNEYDDVVFDYSNGRKVVMRKEQYYKIGNVSTEPGEYAVYDDTETKKKILQTKHWGPWDLDPGKEKLTEATGTNILVVDVQPSYDAWSGAVVEEVAQLLNRTTGNIYVLYNAEGQTNDGYIDVINYLIDKGGMREEVADRINYFSKEYGFFRPWMDQGVPDRIIIKTVRAMVQRRVNDSRMLDINTVLTPEEQQEFQSHFKYSSWDDEGIYMPDFMPISILKKISPFYMCGGGRQECLREIELLCNAFNIRYRRIDQLIYG